MTKVVRALLPVRSVETRPDFSLVLTLADGRTEGLYLGNIFAEVRELEGRYAAATPVVRKLLVALVLIALPGCGAGSDGVEEEPRSAPTLAPAGPLVVLQRLGGIAGSHDRVSVDAVGVATIVSDRSPNASTRTLSAADLSALRTALQRAEIATLQRNYLDRQARDAYQYDVTYQGITVTADEGVIPDKLRPVVDQLSKLIA